MPRLSMSPEARKHLIIMLIALALALGFLLIRADRASAADQFAGHNDRIVAIDEESSFNDFNDVQVSQITGDDYQNAVTLERLMILGMIGLVVLTWYYLKWRPPPDQEEQQRPEPDRD